MAKVKSYLAARLEKINDYVAQLNDSLDDPELHMATFTPHKTDAAVAFVYYTCSQCRRDFIVNRLLHGSRQTMGSILWNHNLKYHPISTEARWFWPGEDHTDANAKRMLKHEYFSLVTDSQESTK